tara:strand:+ start:199 stop:564 length:366 start_codon:yes stop_codon:yes gene_type:complete
MVNKRTPKPKAEGRVTDYVKSKLFPPGPLDRDPNVWSYQGMPKREARSRVAQHKALYRKAEIKANRFIKEGTMASKEGASSLARKRTGQYLHAKKRMKKYAHVGVKMQSIYNPPTRHEKKK